MTKTANASTALLIVAIFFAAIAMQWMLMTFDVGIYDEGLSLYGAARVEAGDVPYRDFWTLYGPGSFYVIAGFFNMFGESVWSARLFDSVCRAVIVVMVYLLGRRVAPRWSALVAALCGLLVVIAARGYDAPIFPAFACALLVPWFVIRAIDGRRPGSNSFAAGVVTGAAVAFRNDIGVYAFMVAVVGLIHLHRGIARIPRAAALRCTLLFLAGCSIVVVPIVLALLVTVPGHYLYEDLIRIPFTIYAPFRGLPFPGLEPLRSFARGEGPRLISVYIVYLPLLVLAAAGWCAMAHWRRPETSDESPSRTILLRMLTLLLVCMILKGFVRVSLGHMSPALVTCAILGAAAIAKPRHFAVRLLLACLCIAISAKLAPHMESRDSAMRRLTTLVTMAQGGTTGPCTLSSNPRIGCFHLDADLAATIDFVDSHSKAEDPIYVGASRHDRVFINDVALYFLAARHAATRWHDMHPGVQTSLAIQQEMVADFERTPPVLIVVDDKMDEVREPNASAISSQVKFLDAWIGARYEETFRYGSFRAFEQRDRVSAGD